ncbi:MAG: Hemin transport protein HemS [Myxococcota bacterium]|nr:Hemin transport protein HemS [Myxococcota bacterium]
MNAAENISVHSHPRWSEFRARNPGVRIRDAAKMLGVPEAGLLASELGEQVIRLSNDFQAQFHDLEKLGECMALTRNDHAVIEKIGRYRNISFQGHAGLVLDENIDLRLFPSCWKYSFASVEEMKSGLRYSIQFFDESGDAVHKVYLEHDAPSLFNSFVNQHRAASQEEPGPFAPRKFPQLAPGPEIDFAGFLDAWERLEDTHDFFPLLKKFRVSRTQAMASAEGRFTQHAPPAALRLVANLAAQREIPIMVFVGNRGCIEIHTGPIRRVQVMGPWFNILDPGFNLHLREDAIAQAWFVRKPTRDGDVNSLELFDANGESIAMLSGKRKPGIPEQEAWRELLADVQSNQSGCHYTS